MKVAFALSGQGRFLSEGHKFFQKYLFNANPDCEFHNFAHIWHNPEMVGKPYDGAEWLTGGKAGFVRESTKQDLIDLYKPHKYVIEPQRDFTNHRDYSSYCTRTRPDLLHSFYYSMRRVLLLIKEYTGQINIKYDWIIYARPDWVPLQNIVLSQYDPSKYQMPDDILPNVDNKHACNTNFVFSSAENMYKMAQIYPNLDRYFDEGCRFGGECLTGHALEQMGVKNPVPIRYGFIRQFCAPGGNEIAYNDIERFL